LQVSRATLPDASRVRRRCGDGFAATMRPCSDASTSWPGETDSDGDVLAVGHRMIAYHGPGALCTASRQAAARPLTAAQAPCRTGPQPAISKHGVLEAEKQLPLPPCLSPFFQLPQSFLSSSRPPPAVASLSRSVLLPAPLSHQESLSSHAQSLCQSHYLSPLPPDPISNTCTSQCLSLESFTLQKLVRSRY